MGRLLGSVRAMYSSPLSWVNVGGRLTDWFSVGAGVRQGDSLSLTLFALFINDLAQETKDTNRGIYVDDDTHVPRLLYADDVMIMAPKTAKLRWTS